MPIAVDIVTQEKVVFSEPNADMVIIPAVEGTMGVLPHHAPVLTTLGFGELVIRKGRAEERFAIYGGVVDVRPDKVVVLADLAESSFDIDEAAMEAARAGAEKVMREGVPPEENREAQLTLRRAELALKLSRKVRTGGASVLRIVEEEEGG
ncbi:MAG: ATP synthase F1 subunit epsilon [Anaerolineae bacterium]|nr:ATP synthase F1 subunit epsilon [Anaerolineae bacterium]NUQ05028.1 ATP synthase F1 subunit epsilon [Anaerolineae bacterium]